MFEPRPGRSMIPHRSRTHNAGQCCGEGGLPPEHLHPQQDERFEVLEGAVKAIIDGQERRYQAGQSFEIPARTPHQMAGDGPARLRWEVQPALRTAEFFERAYSGDPGTDFLETFAAEFQLTGT